MHAGRCPGSLGGVHSIELLLDPVADAAVRTEWALLADAGLPSQASHASPSNAPHVTLVARPVLDGAADDEVGAVLAAALPLPLELGPLVVFGAPPRGLVLARLVVVRPALLDLHARVHDALPADADEVPHTLPGRWTPHVTLAHRLRPEQLARALEVLHDDGLRDDASGPVTDPPVAAAVAAPVRALSAHRWDGGRRRITVL